MPLVKGTSNITDKETAKREAETIGYPVLMKAASGGGGRGMFVASDDKDIDASLRVHQRRQKKLLEMVTCI